MSAAAKEYGQADPQMYGRSTTESPTDGAVSSEEERRLQAFLPAHREHLHDSGLRDAEIDLLVRGGWIRSGTSEENREWLNLKENDRRDVAGMVFKYHDQSQRVRLDHVGGVGKPLKADLNNYSVRCDHDPHAPDKFEDGDGSDGPRYLNPGRAELRIYIPPECILPRDRLRDPDLALYIVEGEKKRWRWQRPAPPSSAWPVSGAASTPEPTRPARPSKY